MEELRKTIKLFQSNVRDKIGQMRSKGMDPIEIRKEIERTIRVLKDNIEVLTFVRDEVISTQQVISNETQPSPYMTVEEVCSHLKGVTAETLRNYRKTKKLLPINLNSGIGKSNRAGKLLYLRSDVDSFVLSMKKK